MWPSGRRRWICSREPPILKPSFHSQKPKERRESDRLFVQYLVNWVANCKLIFLALLVVVVLFGNEIITVCAVIATIVSIGIYFVSLHPIIKKLDEMGEIQPKGYSKTLALTIGAFMVMFSGALVLYFVL